MSDSAAFTCTEKRTEDWLPCPCGKPARHRMQKTYPTVEPPTFECFACFEARVDGILAGRGGGAVLR